MSPMLRGGSVDGLACTGTGLDSGLGPTQRLSSAVTFCPSVNTGVTLSHWPAPAPLTWPIGFPLAKTRSNPPWARLVTDKAPPHSYKGADTTGRAGRPSVLR